MLRKAITIMACMVVLGISLLSAKIWTVDSNQGNSAADFKTFQAAHDGAASGDTLYFSGSSVNYGNCTLTKKLTVIGPGYYLSSNTDLQANPAAATVSHVTFNGGSQGSIMMGMTVTGLLRIDTNNITIKRNRLYYDTNYPTIDIRYSTGTISNIILAQNIIFLNSTSTSTSAKVIDIADNCTGIFIVNNYINTGHSDVQYQYSIYANASNTDVQVINNTIRGQVYLGDLGTFNNNILRAGAFSASKIIPRNNLADTTQFGTANGNQENVDMATVFDSTKTTSDSRWMLDPASPAKGAGLNGEDLGMYGGMSPYVLSGIPPVPSIYHFTAPVSGSKAQGLPVRIKIRSNK